MLLGALLLPKSGSRTLDKYILLATRFILPGVDCLKIRNNMNVRIGSFTCGEVD